MSGIVDGDFFRFPESVSSHNTLRLLVSGKERFLMRIMIGTHCGGFNTICMKCSGALDELFPSQIFHPAKTFCGARVYFIERCDNKQKLLTRTAVRECACKSSSLEAF